MNKFHSGCLISRLRSESGIYQMENEVAASYRVVQSDLCIETKY
jgi:hypothetical protein